jgi:hypothetical protein
VYGVSLVAAGIFRADPALGLPTRHPGRRPRRELARALHLACGAVGFLCLVIGCFVLARRLTRGWATFTRVTGVVFLAAFVGIASGAGSVATTVAFVLAVVLVCAWMSALAVHLYRTTAPAALCMQGVLLGHKSVLKDSLQARTITTRPRERNHHALPDPAQGQPSRTRRRPD